ncbi:tyrosine-type recombinase/integrase [Streptomyces sp. NPDC020192]|uniref:tyrosine-type recombinase/integrase n=1 Tax=Streptomyces sp. NPDC020192 TaxID=3365066 RepID=UPI0037A1F39A
MAAVRKAAQRAGLGRVTPHQLRHTLATQAINRGMSLEAIASLLGHKSLSLFQPRGEGGCLVAEVCTTQ